MLNENIARFISDNSLLSKEGKHIVALSGGADSVALLLLLKDLGYNVEAAHCNFHLRGDESDRDEMFCFNLCKDKQIPFHVIHFDTKLYANTHKVSIEMAARTLRYNYFKNLRQDINAESVCVAHHIEDSVETTLINLIRGTGLKGLSGISVKNGYVVRPLLCVTKQEIETYLASIGQDYVTDSTNFSDDVVRNKIRLNIIPMLKAINPSVISSIERTSSNLRDAGKLIDSILSDLKNEFDKKHSLPISSVKSTGSPKYCLFYILSGYGFRFSQVEDLLRSLDGQTGKVWHSSNYSLLLDRGRLIIDNRISDERFSFRIPEQGTYHICDNVSVSVRNVPVDDSFIIGRGRDRVTLDAKDIHFPLLIRTTEEGDRFMPFGMNGVKLVSDYLTDRKKNLFDKRKQMVVADSTGNIIWLVGERTDNRYRISCDTKESIVIEMRRME